MFYGITVSLQCVNADDLNSQFRQGRKTTKVLHMENWGIEGINDLLKITEEIRDMIPSDLVSVFWARNRCCHWSTVSCATTCCSTADHNQGTSIRQSWLLLLDLGQIWKFLFIDMPTVLRSRRIPCRGDPPSALVDIPCTGISPCTCKHRGMCTSLPLSVLVDLWGKSLYKGFPSHVCKGRSERLTMVPPKNPICRHLEVFPLCKI